MIRNYLKIGLRNLLKYRMASVINIGGLALAVGCCLVVFVFLDWSFHLDTLHTKLDRIHVLEKVANKNGQQVFQGPSPAPMGEILRNQFPQIKNTARVNFVGGVIKEGDRVFRQTVSFVDDSFYEIFDFPIKWGNKSAFTDPNGIILTEELSEMLFGNANPLGKNVNIRFNQNGQEFIENFTVKGVFAKKPYETSFYFSALIPFKKMASLAMNYEGDWSKNVEMTFIETEKETSSLPSDAQLKPYLNLYNTANKDNPIVAFHFQALKTMNLHSYQLGPTRFFNTHIIGLIMLGSIAIAILLMVCFNYMNIAVASASQRLKEIGVRKSMGSSRKQIIFQFLMENTILCTVGVAMGVMLARAVFIPWFSQIASFDLTQKLFTNNRLWMALGGLLLLTVLGGSAYPSLYISSLKPISIVKGNLTLGSRNRFRKVLLGFQFFLTFVGLSMALAFIRENQITRAKSWGYEPANNVVTKLTAGHGYDLLKSELKTNNKIASVTGSVQPLGNWSKQLVVRIEGKPQTVHGLQALPNFATSMGIKIENGRDLNENIESDKTASVLVNQAFLNQMNWKTGIGKTIEYETKKYLIVGETNDFRFENFESKVEPLILMGCQPTDVQFAYIKTNNSLLTAAHMTIEGIWKKTFPDTPYEYYYQDTVFDQYYGGFMQVIRVLSAASLIMVIVSITGIFGLALLILARKMKEISVRKVLGAGMGNISFQILKEFLAAIIVAFVVGVPISYLLTNSIFVQFSPESQVSFFPLVVTLGGLLVMVLLSVLWHLYKAFVANPTEFLKSE